MGRTRPTVVLQPQAYRKDARAKQAKATINKTIPALLTANPRAQRGIDNGELIPDPPRHCHHTISVDRKSNQHAGHHPPEPELVPSTPRVRIVVADTITTALQLFSSSTTGGKQAEDGKIGVLNMASPLRPGGGFLNGATSQEESLCMRTTLYPSLQENFYRLPDVGGVWTPDVLIFRDGTQDAGELRKGDRRYVGVVSAGMLRFPDLDEDGEAYASQKDRDLVERKMRAVMRIFEAKRIERVVLGAWGCGAYGNPVKEIASGWRKVLLPDSNMSRTERKKSRTESHDDDWSGIKEVVFAIKDRAMAEKFGKCFDDDIEVEYTDVDEEAEPEYDPEDESIRELNRRISELEIQIPQARSDVLKRGLETILDALQKQLKDRNNRARISRKGGEPADG